MTILPNSDSLVFRETTDPEVIKYTHFQNGNNWKGELSLEEYVQREAVLGKSEIGQKGKSTETIKRFPEGHEWVGLKYFILENLEVNSEKVTDRIVSSCEILGRLGSCVYPGSKVEPCLVATIGGVYTSPENRGKGYARQMIEALNDHLDGVRDAPNSPDLIKNMVVILYSEVGEYYSNMGFKSEHVPLHIVTQLDEIEKRYCHQGTIEGRELGFGGYEELVALQDKAFSRNLEKVRKLNPYKFIFTVSADIDLYKWFAHRDLFIMKKTNRMQKDLKFGFALSDNSHIIWHHNWSGDSLIIVKVFMEEGKPDAQLTLCKLITMAVKETKKTGLKSLVFWDQEIEIKQFPELQKELLEKEHESNVYAKNSSLSAFRPPKGFGVDNVIWDNNTKFCWF